MNALSTVALSTYVIIEKLFIHTHAFVGPRSERSWLFDMYM